MKKVLLIGLAVVLVGSAWVVLTVSNKATANNVVVSSSQVKQKFMDSSEGKNAFLIYPGPLNSQAKMAINGFDLKTETLSDNSTKVTLTSTNPEYKDQSYTIKPGEKLYFIEMFAGDDNVSENKDNSLRDDTAVIVDAQGYAI